jgi:phage shock protein C
MLPPLTAVVWCLFAETLCREDIEAMEEKKFTRSTTDKMIAGVCGGLAAYFGIDTVIVRVLFVLFGLAGGPGVLLYIILWIVMPEDTGGMTVQPPTDTPSGE